MGNSHPPPAPEVTKVPEHVPVLEVPEGTVHRRNNGEFTFHSKFSQADTGKKHYAVRSGPGNVAGAKQVFFVRKPPQSHLQN